MLVSGASAGSATGHKVLDLINSPSFVRQKSDSVDKTALNPVLSTESHVWPEMLTDCDATGH